MRLRILAIVPFLAATMAHEHGASSSPSTSPASDSADESSMMHTVFTLAHDTPLFTTAFTPTSTGSYAGACIFLLVLAAILRSLLAYRHLLERRWHQKRQERRPIVVAQSAQDTASKGAGAVSLPPRPASGEKWTADQWRVTVDIPRAFLVVAITAVGYLLMLAVMTFNVGYFLSVLAGVFVGELGLGRFGTGSDH